MVASAPMFSEVRRAASAPPSGVQSFVPEYHKLAQGFGLLYPLQCSRLVGVCTGGPRRSGRGTAKWEGRGPEGMTAGERWKNHGQQSCGFRRSAQGCGCTAPMFCKI